MVCFLSGFDSGNQLVGQPLQNRRVGQTLQNR
jgi:hypothetical protein